MFIILLTPFTVTRYMPVVSCRLYSHREQHFPAASLAMCPAMDSSRVMSYCDYSCANIERKMGFCKKWREK